MDHLPMEFGFRQPLRQKSSASNIRVSNSYSNGTDTSVIKLKNTNGMGDSSGIASKSSMQIVNDGTPSERSNIQRNGRKVSSNGSEVYRQSEFTQSFLSVKKLTDSQEQFNFNQVQSPSYMASDLETKNEEDSFDEKMIMS
mmetsp:Transcript_19488/g.18614  ORF Transcript_19488/g.18614 Transcript_19488/m.18614 type:complete len:141 (+) Transcript_19488:604-1026(+)